MTGSAPETLKAQFDALHAERVRTWNPPSSNAISISAASWSPRSILARW